MVNELSRIESYVIEYLESMTGIEKPVEIDFEIAQMILAKKHGWTKNGAAILTHLAQDYGVFILSHSLALAIVLGKEDGKLGL